MPGDAQNATTWLGEKQKYFPYSAALATYHVVTLSLLPSDNRSASPAPEGNPIYANGEGFEPSATPPDASPALANTDAPLGNRRGGSPVIGRQKIKAGMKRKLRDFWTRIGCKSLLI